MESDGAEGERFHELMSIAVKHSYPSFGFQQGWPDKLLTASSLTPAFELTRPLA